LSRMGYYGADSGFRIGFLIFQGGLLNANCDSFEFFGVVF